MDEKFTPQEIAESLRMCSNPVPCDGCTSIEHKGNCDCADWLKRTAADMIEELAAEVEKLQGELIQRNDELLKLQEENRWIPASERNPDRELEEEPKGEDGKPLLGGYECIAQIEGAKRPTALWYCHIDGEGVWTDESGENFYRVTHWKPMPKGPEVGHD